MRKRLALFVILLSAVFILLGDAPSGHRLSAEDKPKSEKASERPKLNPGASLTPEHWKQLDKAVDAGLSFLATQQESDGSFKCHVNAQPAVTSLGVMAFLSRGHLPDQGPYGKQVHNAIDFVLASQQPNGLLFPGAVRNQRSSIVGTYNHAISGVMLSEAYGMVGPAQQQAIRRAIPKALKFTRSEQRQEPGSENHGGWRYLTAGWGKGYADMSVTGWHMMFYRSARNAEFDVPEEHMKDGVSFAERCFDEKEGTFRYSFGPKNVGWYSRGVAGAGVLSLALGGKHDTQMARSAAQYILDHPFDRFNAGGLTQEDRFFYGAYYCSQAMYQLGGKYWDQFYPVLLKTLVDNQRPDGSWDVSSHPDDGIGGYVPSTAFSVLSLTPPYQLLPIYQQ